MGNVLVYFKPQWFVDRYDLSKENKELLLNKIFRSPEWLSMDAGIQTEKEVCSLMKKRLPQLLHEPMTQLIMAWDQPLIEIEGMYELVEELKQKGYDLYLLSNASQRQHDYWERVRASHFLMER